MNTSPTAGSVARRSMRALEVSTSSTSAHPRNVVPRFGCRSVLLGLLVGTALSTHGALLVAQVQVHDLMQFTPPATVGRYSLETLKQSRVLDRSQIYRYFDGMSSRVEVMISDRNITTMNGTPAQAIRRQAQRVKTALLADRRSGRYDDYVIALDGIHVDTLATSAIPGYRIVAVVRRANRVELVFFCAYALPRSIVQVRALVPQTEWQVTDVPAFADQLVAELSRDD